MPLLTNIATDAAAGDTTSAEGTPPPAPGAGDSAANEKAAAEAEAAGKLPFTDAKQLKLAEGFVLDEAIVPLASKLGLTAAQAQALVDYQAGASKAQLEAREAAADAAAKAAVETLKADKDIGGAKFQQSMAIAQKALVKFGGPINPKTGRGELVDALDSMQLADGSMLGDSPVLAKFLVAVGKALGEDSVGGHLGQPAPKTEANDEGTFLRSLYKKTPTLKFPGT